MLIISAIAIKFYFNECNAAAATCGTVIVCSVNASVLYVKCYNSKIKQLKLTLMFF